MTLEEAITTRISADQGRAVMLAEDGGWSARLPGFPGLALQVVVDSRPQHMKGFQRVRQTTVQADVYAATRAEAVGIRNSLIALLVPAFMIEDVRFQRAMVSAVRAGREPEQSGERQRYRGELARESIDFIFTHNAN